MRIIILLFLSVLTIQTMPTQALAIINAEDMDLTADEDGLVGKLDFSLSGSSGNSVKLTTESSGRLIWQHGQYTNMLVGSFSYGKSRGVRDTNKSFVHLRHRYALTESWGVEGFAQAQKNEFARLKLRTLLGGGVRWSYQLQALSCNVGLGSFYEREALRAGVIATPVTRLWRGNSYLALRYAFNGRVRLQNTVYFQPAWKDRADYRLLDDAALHVALSDNLDLKVAMELSQDSRPPAGVKSSDVSYKTGLSFRF